MVAGVIVGVGLDAQNQIRAASYLLAKSCYMRMRRYSGKGGILFPVFSRKSVHGRNLGATGLALLGISHLDSRDNNICAHLRLIQG